MMLMAAEIRKELSESKKTMLKQLLRCVTTVTSIFQYFFGKYACIFSIMLCYAFMLRCAIMLEIMPA